MLAITDVRDNGSAALAHAVYFGYFDVMPELHHGGAEQTAGQKCSLTADTDNHNTDYFVFHFLSPLVTESRLCGRAKCRHRNRHTVSGQSRLFRL